MPAELQEGFVSTYEWQEFVSRANQCLAAIHLKAVIAFRVRQVIYSSCFLAACGLVLTGAGVLSNGFIIFEYIDRYSGLVLYMSFLVGLPILCVEQVWQACGRPRSLRQMCANISSDERFSKMSFILKDEMQEMPVTSRICRSCEDEISCERRVYYIEVRVAQVGAATSSGLTVPQQASMMTDLEQQQ